MRAFSDGGRAAIALRGATSACVSVSAHAAAIAARRRSMMIRALPPLEMQLAEPAVINC